MDLMGIDPHMAEGILRDELMGFMATRYRLTMRLRILNRVEADVVQREALERELIKLEEVIKLYESKLVDLIGYLESKESNEQSNHTYALEP